MKKNLTLVITSLITVVLSSIHLAHDVVRGSDQWNRGSLIGVAILIFGLFGTLVVPDRRSGVIIMLIGGLAAMAMPVIHARINLNSVAVFFFIWTLFAMGATGGVTVLLAIRALRQNART